MSKTEPERLLVDKRDLVELYAAALDLRQATDAASRVRIDVAASCNKLELLLRRIAPGLVLEVQLSHEVTPVEIPRPTKPDGT